MKNAMGWKLITCFLPAIKAEDLIAALRQEKGVMTADVSLGRGVGAARRRGLGAWDEVAIITVPVSESEAEDIFAFIFAKGDLDRPKGGLIVMQALDSHTNFALPALPLE